MTLTRDSQCMVVSTADDTIKLMDRSSGELLAEFIGHKNEDYMIENCVNTKDNQVMSGSAEGLVYCWDLITQKVIATLAHDTSQVVNSLASHPTKEDYLTASGGTVYLWSDKEVENDEDSPS